MNISTSNGNLSVPIPTPVATHWLHPGIRGLAALIAGLILTFTTAFWTPEFGLYIFAVYTLIFAIVTLAFFPKTTVKSVKNVAVFISVINLVATLAAIFYALAQPTTMVFILIVAIWGSATGFAELYLGFSKKQKFAESRDWLILGFMSVILATATILIDPNFRLEYVLPGDGDTPAYEGAVTGPLNALGILCIYLIIVGLFLVIGAYSLREPETENES